MNPVYTRQQLETKKRPQLWAICETFGLPKHASNAKCVEAILEVQPVKVETETIITTESVNDATVVYANGVSIAAIAYNDTDSYLTHPWVVMVGGVEIHATNTWASCYSYITWHYKQSTLPVAQPQPIDEQAIAQFELDTYIQDQAEDIAPSIQVLEQHGNEFVVANLDNGNHYVVRPSHPDRQQRCECPHCYYRGAKCKHQQAVEKQVPKKKAKNAVLAGIALSVTLANPLAAVKSDTYEPPNNGHPDGTIGSGTRVVFDCTYRGSDRREGCFYFL